MPSVEELINDPVIQEYIKIHQGASSRITKAAEILVKEKDALQALIKLLPAMSQKEINVFFSYKTKDESAAQTVVEVLRKSSASKLNVTHQGDFRNIVGKLWREKIRNAVQSANWFILLFPDPSDDWDWCLFETGLFEGQYTSADRLICLHHPDTKIPDPIKEYHAVPATIPKVEEFLRMVLIDNNPLPGMDPVNQYAESQIPDFAKEIVKAIRPPQESLVREIFEPWIELEIQDLSHLNNLEDMDNAKIIKANKEARSLFGYLQKPSTWGELRSGLNELPDDARWRDELFAAIKNISHGMVFDPIQAVFKTKTDKIYRPVACAVDRIGSESGPISLFHITFSKEVGTVDHTSMPRELAMLASYLRFTFRFRWEILERFSKKPMPVDDVVRLQNSFDRIESDAKSRDIAGVDSIINLFTHEQAEKIHNMYVEWGKIKSINKNGELDIAIKNKDVEKIPELLSGFIPQSQEFLQMAADRFSQLITEVVGG